MNALIYTLGVVVFVIGVVLSIALHELGHMYPAKKFGIKVTQFFVGFGNTVWSTRRGETEYGFKSIPLGGYVKLVGMLPPAKDADPHEVRNLAGDPAHGERSFATLGAVRGRARSRVRGRPRLARRRDDRDGGWNERVPRRPVDLSPGFDGGGAGASRSGTRDRERSRDPGGS